MANPTTAESAFRRAEREFGTGSDALWEFLEANKHEDPTLAIGWATERARRYFNLDQAGIAARTAVYNDRGDVIVEPISKSFVSAMLSGRSRVSPEVYVRLADACEVNELDFYLAEHWVRQASIASFSVPERELAMPIIQKILELPKGLRIRGRAVVLAVLDSIKGVGEHGAAAGVNVEDETVQA